MTSGPPRGWMSSEKYTHDFVIAGAGIVGLCAAFEIKGRYPRARILILEKEPAPGLHASGRNSGVLHSGIYYTTDTLKARICSAGAKRMREFAAEYGIACEPRGKVILATCEEDLPAVERLMKNARENQLRAEILSEDGIRNIEPHARPYKTGVYTPDTAVIDSGGVVRKLFEILSGQGVEFCFNREIGAIDPVQKEVSAAGDVFKFGYFINCAGAHADKLAACFGLGKKYALLPFKGLYFKLRAERQFLVKSNIYPVPDLAMPFLGIHLTRVISGEVYLGPTAIPALGRENYGLFEGINLQESFGILGRLLQMYWSDAHSFRNLVHREVLHYLKPYFVAAARRLVPELRAEDLVPSGKVGIRPQLIRLADKKLEMDFVIEQTPDSLHVLNAISPAFTSAFAFAALLADRIEQKEQRPAAERKL